MEITLPKIWLIYMKKYQWIFFCGDLDDNISNRTLPSLFPSVFTNEYFRRYLTNTIIDKNNIFVNVDGKL